MSKKIKPEGVPRGVFMIRDLETMRVVADPLRTQVIEILIHQPQTVREVADKLGLAASKLYYHIGLLEKHGLVQVVETRQVGNLLEKVYRATASELDIDKSLLSFSTTSLHENIYSMVVSTLDATREDLLRSLQARQTALDQGAPPQPRRVVLNRNIATLSDARAADLQDKLCAVVQEFLEADEVEPLPEETNHLYALMVACYPTFYYPPEAGASTSEQEDS